MSTLMVQLGIQYMIPIKYMTNLGSFVTYKLSDLDWNILRSPNVKFGGDKHSPYRSFCRCLRVMYGLTHLFYEKLAF